MPQAQHVTCSTTSLLHLNPPHDPSVLVTGEDHCRQCVCVGYERACRHSSLPRDGMISIASEATSPVRLGWTSDALKKKSWDAAVGRQVESAFAPASLHESQSLRSIQPCMWARKIGKCIHDRDTQWSQKPSLACEHQADRKASTSSQPLHNARRARLPTQLLLVRGGKLGHVASSLALSVVEPSRTKADPVHWMTDATHRCAQQSTRICRSVTRVETRSNRDIVRRALN